MEEVKNINQADDGSLSCLNIEVTEANKQFQCKETTQQELTNMTFWVIDYLQNVKTRFGEDKYLVYIKFNLDDPDNEARKFFTGSSITKQKLDFVRSLNKFPRRCTMRRNKNMFWIE